MLGSGLDPVAEQIEPVAEVPYASLPGHPVSGVAGHAGRYVFGRIRGVEVVAARGRVHLYEGHSASGVTASVRAMAGFGIERLVLTNAAGTLNPGFPPGHWMLVRDHLNLTGTSPFEGRSPVAFHDMTAVYADQWAGRAVAAAAAAGIALFEGVYAGVRGPQYETPAEIRMLRALGADAVGMSTVLEAMEAHALGLEVIAFSCLTNWAAGLAQAPLSHEEVIATGRRAAGQLVDLLTAIIEG